SRASSTTSAPPCFRCSRGNAEFPRRLPMKILLSTALALAFAFSGAACAQTRDVTDPSAPRALQDEGPVAVQWTDPAGFTEIRGSMNSWEARRGNWVQELAEHLRDGIRERIGEGERVEILITDIRRAGDFEPGRGPQIDHVRIMRDIYWPRMTLEFSHHDAAGGRIAQGTRQLSDPSYLTSRIGPLTGTDPLRYEKAMIDDWLRKEFGPAR